MPHRVPEDMPDRMLEDMPDRMPEGMPDRMPDRMSDRMPEDMPDKVPECLPDRMPADLPDNMLLTSKLILNDYPDYGLRVYGLLLVPKLNGFVCLPRGYIDVCFRVLLVMPKWSGTTSKALILGSPVPMNTFTEELQNEPIP